MPSPEGYRSLQRGQLIGGLCKRIPKHSDAPQQFDAVTVISGWPVCRCLFYATTR